MEVKHFLSVADLNGDEIEQLIKQALLMQRGPTERLLSGKSVALLFEKPSLRTKVSFDIAIEQLGGHPVYLSPAEVGMGKRESVSDVARVLCRYVDGIVARTFAHQTLLTLAEYSSVPVVNALSDLEHPCQALADFLTIYENKNRLANLTLAFIGDGNNVANSLLLAASLTGVNFHVASPPGYEIKQEMLSRSQELAVSSGSRIELTNDPMAAVKDVDVVYTDVWTSMGQEAEAEERRRIFSDYQVNEKLLSLAKKDALFMHPLPAHHGEEVSSGLLDNPHSVVFAQAENRLHLQKALLAKLLSSSNRG